MQQLCVQTNQKQTTSVTVTQNFGGETAQAISQPPLTPQPAEIHHPPFPNVAPSPIGESVSVQAPQQSEQIFEQKGPRLMKRRLATQSKCRVFVKWAVDHIRKHDKERITQKKLIECFIQSGTPYNFKDVESMFKSKLLYHAIFVRQSKKRPRAG